MNNDFELRLTNSPAVLMKSGKHLTRYKKELIKIGKFVKVSVGLAFEVTLDTLHHWEETFKQWTGNGNKVPVPPGHKEADKPEKNQGWVLDMFVENGSLWGIMELNQPELALTTDVSIFVPADFVDGAGNKYIQPITHCALCTNPVIPGLANFQELSLSLGDVQMDTKKLAELLGLPEDADEKAITAAISKANTKAPAKALSQSEPASGALVKLVAENRNIKISGLVKAGLISPATQKAIEEQYTVTESLTLSLSGGWNDGFDFLVQILTENKTVALGGLSGPQLMELANARTQGAANPIAADVARRRVDAGLDK